MRRIAFGRDLLPFAARCLNQAPVGLLLLAEGFWIGIVYSLMQIESREAGPLSPLVFALGAAAGAVTSTYGPRFAGARWPLYATLLVGLAGVAGWLLSEHTRLTFLSGNPAAALSAHAGGWLMGLAFLRGILDGGRDRRSAPAESLVFAGVPVIAITYALAATMDRGRLDAFTAQANPDTIAFVAFGLIGLALIRIRWLGSIASVRWSSNRAWLALLLALTAGMLLVAVPASLAIGPLVLLVVALLPVPLFVAGLLVGLDRRLFQIVVSMLVFAVIGVAFVQALLGHSSIVHQGGAGGSSSTITPADQTWLLVAGWLLLVAVIGLTIALAVLLWTRQTPAKLEDVAEERTIDRGTDRERRQPAPRVRESRRQGTPRDAVEAYLAALGLLASRNDLRRRPGETPDEHVRRLRRLELPAPSSPLVTRPLALLAADFELARFGDRALTPAEHRRGVRRWITIRTMVRRWPGGQHQAAHERRAGGEGGI